MNFHIASVLHSLVLHFYGVEYPLLVSDSVDVTSFDLLVGGLIFKLLMHYDLTVEGGVKLITDGNVVTCAVNGELNDSVVDLTSHGYGHLLLGDLLKMLLLTFLVLLVSLLWFSVLVEHLVC